MGRILLELLALFKKRSKHFVFSYWPIRADLANEAKRTIKEASRCQVC